MKDILSKEEYKLAAKKVIEKGKKTRKYNFRRGN